MSQNPQKPVSGNEVEIQGGNEVEIQGGNEVEIRALIDRWAGAVRQQNIAGIRADHDSQILLFDLPGPLFSEGLDAYIETWNKFFNWAEKPIAFAFHNVEITAGTDVAFATAIGHCAGVDSNGLREELEFRLTMGFRKREGAWRIVHEHHSLPAE
jgi:uncharacterized protein (TIGR02246 family)